MSAVELLADEARPDRPILTAVADRGTDRELRLRADLGDGRWAIEGPVGGYRSDREDDVASLLRRLAGACRDRAPHPVDWWARGADTSTDRIAAGAGLRVTRELFELRCPLPPPHPSTLITRPFRPGTDDDAWLRVNNRAFDWHEDQGDWTRDDLRARLAEPWFDADGFLLHERDGRIDGFCWTKVHPETDPPLGEIYVIAADPDAAGRGLGRALTLAGLEHLSRMGLAVGMLYVEHDNERALRLYRELGFVEHHRDRRYSSVD